MHILVTGGAGFIGSHLSEYLINQGHQVSVIDNFDTFYSRTLKEKNIEKLMENPLFELFELDIRDYDGMMNQLVDDYDAIIHLAAKAGVRPSIEAPMEYQSVNVNGTQNMLEFAKNKNIKKFVFGSSSSVYGVNPNYPWTEDDYVLQPISPYASTKISGELLGHVFHKLYDIQFLALRFFTVYGPRQRPDLAINKFCRMIAAGKPIPFYGNGSTQRDYTYVGDIVNGIARAIEYDKTGYEVMNIGNNGLVSLSELVETIEESLDVKAIINRLPEQPGDVRITYANIEKAKALLEYQPKTTLKEGIANFVHWMKLELPSED